MDLLGDAKGTVSDATLLQHVAGSRPVMDPDVRVFRGAMPTCEIWGLIH